MDLKSNVNKIHSDLLNNFEDVKITEKSSKEIQEYIEFSVIREGKEVIIVATKKELSNHNFSWSYYSNPQKKDFLVERNSNVDSLLNDVEDIFNRNRFDSEYLENINK